MDSLYWILGGEENRIGEHSDGKFMLNFRKRRDLYRRVQWWKEDILDLEEINLYRRINLWWGKIALNFRRKNLE